MCSSDKLSTYILYVHLNLIVFTLKCKIQFDIEADRHHVSFMNAFDVTAIQCWWTKFPWQTSTPFCFVLIRPKPYNKLYWCFTQYNTFLREYSYILSQYNSFTFQTVSPCAVWGEEGGGGRLTEPLLLPIMRNQWIHSAPSPHSAPG